MPYTDKFASTDNLIAHLTPIIPSITDPAILATYAGFLSVNAVTVYELAIRDILNDFSCRKHKVFGIFAEKYFAKINGRIKISDLRGQHIKLFGDKYLNKFDRIVQAKQAQKIAATGESITDSYNNLIICRHEFVHGGNPTLTVGEVIAFYSNGKLILESLNEAMRR